MQLFCVPCLKNVRVFPAQVFLTPLRRTGGGGPGGPGSRQSRGTWEEPAEEPPWATTRWGELLLLDQAFVIRASWAGSGLQQHVGPQRPGKSGPLLLQWGRGPGLTGFLVQKTVGLDQGWSRFSCVKWIKQQMKSGLFICEKPKDCCQFHLK